MRPELLPILRAWWLASPFGKRDTDAVFPSTDGLPIKHDNRMGAILDAATKRAKLPRLRVHDLRHQYATASLKAGNSIYAVSKALGHSSTAVTDSVYGHISPEDLAAAAERISYAAPPARS